MTILNGIEQTSTRQIVGDLTDTHADGTLYGYAKRGNEHEYSASCIYPSLASGVTVTAAGTAWAAFPSPTEIIPASTIGDSFDIHWITISGISANGEYDLALYQGAGGAETIIGTVTFVRNAVQSQEGSLHMQTILIAANTRISAALSSSNAAADTANIKLVYHTY